jgi:hypothetical protein
MALLCSEEQVPALSLSMTVHMASKCVDTILIEVVDDDTLPIPFNYAFYYGFFARDIGQMFEPRLACINGVFLANIFRFQILAAGECRIAAL